MNFSRWNKRTAPVAAFIWALLILPCPVLAQNQKSPSSDVWLDALSRFDDALVDVTTGQLLIGGLDKNVRVIGLSSIQKDEQLGATLEPLGDALRTQLEIPAGRGLLVASVKSDGPSAQAGLKQNDILLSLADKPLATVDDLTKQLKTVGESAVPLKILRAGKPITIQVRPKYSVTLGPAVEQKSEYYIGVTMDSIDDALRAQLALPAGQGVVINDVVSGGPAEKAGIKKYDIVVLAAGKPIDKPGTLSNLVQAAKDKPISLNFLRTGKPVTVQITGAVRIAEALSNRQRVELNLGNQAFPTWIAAGSGLRVQNPVVGLAPANADDLRQRLIRLEKDLKAIHAALDKIDATLKATKRE